MRRRLIVNADDFGLSPAVSEGILKAHREGIVTSTTFMVNWPWSRECAALLAGAPRLGVGLHLNLTSGPPVLPPAAVPSLVGRDGRFVKSLWRLRYRVRPEEVRREWEAQIRRFVEYVGRLPTHLDSHHHVHGLPHLAGIVADLAVRYGIPAIRILRPGDLPRPGVLDWPRHWLYRRYLAASSQILARSGLRSPNRLWLADFDRSRLLGWIREAPPGVTELVCHPGYVDATLRRLSGRIAPRQQELDDLTAPEVRQAVAEAGVELCHYGDLAEEG
ncbi:MAG: ChbG/HpnK family deacetylase [Firmicutes bacterium]|nr:ChbG/HpnK family deacetylase [Bacillota bacterium]